MVTFHFKLSGRCMRRNVHKLIFSVRTSSVMGVYSAETWQEDLQEKKTKKQKKTNKTEQDQLSVLRLLFLGKMYVI